MWRWFLIVAVFLIGMQTHPVAAEENIEMQVNMPLSGIMKYGEWSKLEINLNNNGPEFDGMVVLGRSEGYRKSDKTFKQLVHLSAGENKKVFFEIPNEILQSGYMKVQLVKNDSVIDAKQVYQENSDSWGAIVAPNPNAYYFLNMKNEDPSKNPWLPSNWKSLSPKAFPEESWVLRNLQLLAVGNVDSFNDNQIQAIKDWVRQGGQLIISAGPNQDGVLSKYQDVLPITAGHSGTTTKLDLLKQLSGHDQLPISSLPVYNTDEPLFVMKQVGNGRILFANYDVNAEPLASWQYNRQLWKQILTKSSIGIDKTQMNTVNSLDFSLMDLSRVIPGVSLPATEWLAVIWGVYILLVAPLLYLVLKRRDRREWAWGLIPLFAILLSVGVYTIGRLQISKQDSSNSVSNINIIDNDMANVTNVTSFLAVSGGTYNIQAAKGFLTMPLDFKSQRLENSQIAYDSGKGNTITFEQVPYLSEKVAVASGIQRGLGSFQSKLSVEQNKLVGSITNQTTIDMQEVYIDLGIQRIPIGSLKKGETKQVEKELKEFYLPNPTEQVNPLKGPSVEELYANMKSAVVRTVPNTLRIVGVSTEPLSVMNMVSQDKKEFYYNVFNQGFRLSPSQDGRIHYPSGTLEANAVQIDGNAPNNGNGYWEFGRGSVTFHLQLDSCNLVVKRVVIPFDQTPYRPLLKEIHNIKANKWEKLDRSQRVVLDDRLTDYLNSDGNLEVRLTNESAQRLSVPTPYFAVEGEEK
ncbi:hypothetical protein ACQCN2_14520 [Brevibacillus ginsengisoli]|uniref:hypothetical protein n=1 Tax=Brevibacillus ginsengisoli TaxID=363854 RepID=UPI003CEF37FC